MLTSLIVLVNKTKVLLPLLALLGVETLLVFALDGFEIFSIHSLWVVTYETDLIGFNGDTSECSR